MPPKKAPAKKAAKKAPAKSKAKATKAAPDSAASVKPERDERLRRQTPSQIDATGSVPIGANGLPMIQIQVSASELIPTGDYANVCVGPVVLVKWIEDPGDLDSYADLINDLAEVVEGSVADQRELVLQSLQDKVAE